MQLQKWRHHSWQQLMENNKSYFMQMCSILFERKIVVVDRQLFFFFKSYISTRKSLSNVFSILKIFFHYE